MSSFWGNFSSGHSGPIYRLCRCHKQILEYSNYTYNADIKHSDWMQQVKWLVLTSERTLFLHHVVKLQKIIDAICSYCNFAQNCSGCFQMHQGRRLQIFSLTAENFAIIYPPINWLQQKSFGILVPDRTFSTCPCPKPVSWRVRHAA